MIVMKYGEKSRKMKSGWMSYGKIGFFVVLYGRIIVFVFYVINFF